MAQPDERAAAAPPDLPLRPAVVLEAGGAGPWLLTFALAALAAAVFVLLIVPAPSLDPAKQLAWPIFAIAFGLAEVAVIHLAVRGQAVSVSLSEIPLVVGFFFLAPTHLVLAQFVGSGVALVALRRQPPLRVAFALASITLGSCLGILLFQAVALADPTSLPLGSVAAVAGVAAAVVVNSVGSWMLAALQARGGAPARFRRGLVLDLGIAFINASIALVAVVFLSLEPNELWLLGAPAVVGLLGYRAFSAQRERQARLEYLRDCSEILETPLLDEQTIVRVLARSIEMFQATLAEAVLDAPIADGGSRRVAVDGGHEDIGAAAPDLAAGRRALLGVRGEGRILDRDQAAAATMRAGSRGGPAMIVPLRAAGEVRGTLLVAGVVEGGRGTFELEDLRTLEALGSRLGLAVENTGLVRRLAASLEGVAASAELLRTVVDGSPIGMGVAGRDHCWVQANVALCDLLGLAPEEVLGQSTLDRVHPDDLEAARGLEERLFAGEPSARPLERRYVGRDGREVLTEVTARLVRDPSTGDPVVLYTIEDITERRLAEERARSTEERFRQAALAISAVQDPAKVLRAVLESARQTLRAEFAAVATYSDDGTVVTEMEADGLDPGELLQRLGRLPGASGVLGLAPRLGRPIRLRDVRRHPAFAGVPGDHPRLTSFLAVPIPHQGAGSATLYLANKLDEDEFSEADETVAVALATHAAVCLDNARINARALELVRDLDRANLELVQANEAKSRFLASVAHELRTPLHAILVAGELVHDPPSGPLSRDEVTSLGMTIESSGRHMVRLIDDLVDLSRIEAGRLDIRPAPVMVGDVLTEIRSSLAHTAEARGIHLELPGGTGAEVVADPVRLRQILTNLIANALKFTDRGGRVWVDVASTESATLISVHDTGVGIAPEDLERAFLPFEQVSRTSTPGAGLGLAISRSLAELHGGSLTARSVPGAGSTFTLALPHGSPAQRARAAGAAADRPAPAVGGGRPILVVEDDPTAMGLVTDVLRMAGYEVWQARGLGEATALLDDVTPALALLDIRLGDGSGIDLVKALRADADRAGLPILVMSADAMPDDVRRARDAGCSDFLSKPVSPRVLLARIHDLLDAADRTA